MSENSQSRYQKLLSNLTTDQIADFKILWQTQLRERILKVYGLRTVI